MQYFTKGGTNEGKKKKPKAIAKDGDAQAQKIPAAFKTNNMVQHDKNPSPQKQNPDRYNENQMKEGDEEQMIEEQI